MRVKIVAITSAAILVLSLFSYATTIEAECCRKKSNFWFAMASQGLNSGVDAFVTEESSMYAIRGYMQQNPVLAATVVAAYDNWQHVQVNESNAYLYNQFFSLIIPRMEEVMSSHSNTSGILIDEDTYNVAMLIINEHSDVSDPGFVALKSQLINDLNALRGQNYENVRAWFRGELY